MLTIIAPINVYSRCLGQSADGIREAASTAPPDLLVCKYTLSVCKSGHVYIEGKIPKGMLVPL
jgi:hypothetical protein